MARAVAKPVESVEPEKLGPTYHLALGALFFLSGALGLLYEVVWFRRLHLALGVSIFAVGAVISAFMLGLAIGSRWAASSPRLRQNPLPTYACLELGIALYAIAFPWLIGGLEALYPVLFRSLEGHFLALCAMRFVLAFALLLPPTFLMGASLPAVAQAVLARRGDLARRVAWLYAVNTVGGVFGTLAAGFFLIERLGIIASLHVGAAAGVIVAAGALALTRHPGYRGRETVASENAGQKRARSATGPPTPLAALATTAALVAGLVSIAAEVVWTRALVFFIHNSTYAFSSIVAVYLLGIAAGAVLAARCGRTPMDAVRWLAAALAAGSLSLLAAIAIYRHLPALAKLLTGGARLAPSAAGAAETASLALLSWSSALLVIVGQVAAVLFLPALFLGAVFPLALKVASADDRPAAHWVGRLYAANAIGSVTGALLGTFAMVAIFGTRGALLLLAWMPLPIALWALRRGLATRRRSLALSGAFLVALALGSAVAAPADFYRGLFQRRFGDVIWFSEGVSETVAVCDHPDRSRWIQYSDGRGASGTTSFQGGWLYAHLPLLLHPHPRSAAVICFGTGNTLGAASLHRLDVLDGIELSPEVVKAAYLFSDTNHDVTHNPRVRLVIEDGRNFLLATDRRYDVISEEPPLVHTAGVVNLYSRDFYELCSRQLTDDGIVAVWLATWELETQEMRMLVKAFVDVFPYASAWDCTHPFEWVLIGSKKPIAIDLDVLAARMAEPRIAHDLARIEPEFGGIRTPADLLSLHLKGRAALVEFAGAAPAVTDDKSVVDFTTPRHARANFGLGEWITGGLATVGVGEHGLRAHTRLRDFDSIYAFREPATPLIARYGDRDPARFAAELDERTWAREMRAAQLTLAELRRLAAELRAQRQLSQSLEIIEHGFALVPRDASAPLYAMRAQLFDEQGRVEEARAARAQATALDEAMRERLARALRQNP